MNEIIADEKDINNEILENYLNYQNPSFLVKDLIGSKQNKNENLVNNINNEKIDLIKDINRKEIPENENPKKVADIVEKIIDFNKQQRGKELSCMSASCPLNLATQLKILTLKQVLQRLPIALAQVKASNTSENILNEIRQIICSFYQANL